MALFSIFFLSFKECFLNKATYTYATQLKLKHTDIYKSIAIVGPS